MVYIAVLAIKSAIQLWLNALNGQMHCSINLHVPVPMRHVHVEALQH